MNIKLVIKQKHGLDIDTINLLKLYKIENADISEQDLQIKFSDIRRRWQQSANSTFEKAAERDRAHLQNADKYENILLDKKLLKALFSYYNKNETDEEATAFAKEFFQFIKKNNKTISKKDVEFFFMYFSEQEKNKKAITEMLRQDFKILSLKSDDDEVHEEPEKEKSGFLLEQNRFRKETLRILHSCELKYIQLQSSSFLKEKEPKLAFSMYDFLRLSGSGLNDLKKRLERVSAEAFEQRQNSTHGNEYIPLTEFYNSVKDMISQRDINEENFYHFKLLIHYPSFTPYMYLLETIDTDCVNQFLNVIGPQYEFAGEEELLYVYLKPLIEGNHFICEADRHLAAKMLHIAQNPAELEQARRKKAAELKRRKAIPIPVRIVKFFAIWPILLVHYIFEIFHFSIRSINRSKYAYYIPLFIPVLLFNTHAMFGISFFDWFSELVTRSPEITEKFLKTLSNTAIVNEFTKIVAGILAFSFEILMVVTLPIIITGFLYYLSCAIKQSTDFGAINKLFENIKETIDNKIIAAYKERKESIYISMIWPIFANILIVAVLTGLIWLLVNAITTGATAYIPVS